MRPLALIFSLGELAALLVGLCSALPLTAGAEELSLPPTTADSPARPILATRLVAQLQTEYGHAPDERFVDGRFGPYLRRSALTLSLDGSEYHGEVGLDLGPNDLDQSFRRQVRTTETFFSWGADDAIQFMVGRLKPAFGAEQMEDDTSTLTIERAAASDAFSVDTQTGVGFSGKIFYPRWHGSLVLAETDAGRRQASFHTCFDLLSPAEADSGPKLTLGIGALSPTRESESGPGRAHSVDLSWIRGCFDVRSEWLAGSPRGDASSAGSTRARGHQVTVAYSILRGNCQVIVRHEKFSAERSSAIAGSSAWVWGATCALAGPNVKLMINHVSGRGSSAGHRLLLRLQMVR